jgi:hypothetical protein
VTACSLLSFKCTSEVFESKTESAWQYPPVRYLEHRTLGVDIVSHALTDWQGALTRKPRKDSMLGSVKQHLQVINMSKNLQEVASSDATAMYT